MKDWTGNSRSSHSTLGARNYALEDRETNDYYATNSSAIDDLFKMEDFNDIWECACGEGHLSKRMIELGKDVYSTDLIDRGFGEGQIDFLTTDKEWNGDIITNPPYRFSSEFVYKGMSILKPNRKLAMFLKLQFLEGIARKKMFEIYPPRTIYVYSFRQRCAMNGDFDKYSKSNAVAYCWYVWEKGFVGSPIIKWI